MLNTISARQIQRDYKKVFERVNKENKPIVVITNNKPVGAIISLDLLDKIAKSMKLELIVNEALEEYKAGKTKTISTREELEDFFDEVRKSAR